MGEINVIRIMSAMFSMIMLAPAASMAQTAQELRLGVVDTHNILNYGMDYGQQRFSMLTQINRDTAKRLVPAWNYSYDDNRAEESQPLVYNGVIYVTTSVATMAIDAKTGKQIWKSKIDYPPTAVRAACCGVINRGAALYEGKLFRSTLDANVVALEAKTGKEIWRVNAANSKDGYSMTAAPLVADGVVMTGISGGEYGIRGFVDGWDPASGAHLWRTYTVPAPEEAGGDTWPGDTWKRGGGPTWITGSFDPNLHLTYWGVGNPAPWDPSVRPGDNLYTCSVLALDPKTGKIAWHYQFSPNNPFDYDSVSEMILTNLDVAGDQAPVLINANRNGIFYVLNRANGKLIAANPYVRINWATGVDLATGHPIETDLMQQARAGKKVEVWPSSAGGKNWSPASFNVNNGLVYANTLNFGQNYRTVPEKYIPGRLYLGVDLSLGWVWPEGSRGALKAIEPLTGKSKWEAPSDVPRFAGVLSTAGEVVFTGKETGEFEAFDANTGDLLWSFQTGSGIEGQPVTWDQDGTQYVAVSSGLGGAYTMFSGDERLSSVPAGGSLWVFALAK